VVTGAKFLKKKRTRSKSELEALREKAYTTWDEDPSYSVPRLAKDLKVSYSTVYGWLKRWKVSHEKFAKFGGEAPTWEDILRAVPDKATLGGIILDHLVVNTALLKVRLDTSERREREIHEQYASLLEEHSKLKKSMEEGVKEVQEALLPVH